MGVVSMSWFRLWLFGFLLWPLALPVASSQETLHLYPIVDGDKLGFIDSSGQERIHPQLQGYACSFRTAQFSQGLAAVDVDEKLAYIDETGKIVLRLPYYFMEPHPFQEGLTRVQIRTSMMGVPDIWTWFDKSGQARHTDINNWQGEFHEGLMRFRTGQYWGYVDHSFQWVIAPQYQAAEDFSEGLAQVGIASDSGPVWAFIDKAGKIVIREKAPYRAAESFSEGLARVEVAPTTGPKAGQQWYGFVDHTGQEVIGPILQSASLHFSEGYAFGCEDCSRRRMAVIDKQGKQVTAPEFDAFVSSEFHEGLAAIRKGTLFGYIDPAGKWAIDPQFDQAYRLSNGLALVRWNSTREWAYIDQHGRTVWKSADRCKYPTP